MTYLVNVKDPGGRVREVLVHATTREGAIQGADVGGGRVLSVWNVTGDVEAEA